MADLDLLNTFDLSADWGWGAPLDMFTDPGAFDVSADWGWGAPLDMFTDPGVLDPFVGEGNFAFAPELGAIGGGGEPMFLDTVTGQIVSASQAQAIDPVAWSTTEGAGSFAQNAAGNAIPWWVRAIQLGLGGAGAGLGLAGAAQQLAGGPRSTITQQTNRNVDPQAQAMQALVMDMLSNTNQFTFGPGGLAQHLQAQMPQSAAARQQAVDILNKLHTGSFEWGTGMLSGMPSMNESWQEALSRFKTITNPVKG